MCCNKSKKEEPWPAGPHEKSRIADAMATVAISEMEDGNIGAPQIGGESQVEPTQVSFETTPNVDKPAESTGQAIKKGFARSLAKRASKLWTKMRSSVMSKVKLSLKLNALVQQDQDEFAQESTAALDAVKSGQSNVTLEAKSKSDLKNINYLQQGDAEYYTDAAIKLRHSLRGDHRVVEQVTKFWRYIPKEDKDYDATIGGLTPRQSVEIHIVKGVYSATVVLLQLVLLPEFGMEGDMNYDPDEDWLDDNKGLEIMAYPNFFDAMFELADMWCESVSPEAYSNLLEKLYNGFVEKEGIYRELLKKFGYVPPPWWPGEPTTVPSPRVKSIAAPPQEPRVVSARNKAPPPPLHLTPPERRHFDVANPGQSTKVSIVLDEPVMKKAPQWYADYMKNVFQKHRTEDGSLEVTVQSQPSSKSFSMGQKSTVRQTECLPPQQMVLESNAQIAYELVDFSPKSRRGSSRNGGANFSNSPSAAQARRYYGSNPSDDHLGLAITPRSESLPLISRPSQKDLSMDEPSACVTSRTPSRVQPSPSSYTNTAAGSGRSWIWKPAELPAMRPVTASLPSKDVRCQSPLGRPTTSSGGGHQRHLVLLQPPSSPLAGGRSRTVPLTVDLSGNHQVGPLLVLAAEKSVGSPGTSPKGSATSPQGFKGSLKLKGSLKPPL